MSEASDPLLPQRAAEAGADRRRERELLQVRTPDPALAEAWRSAVQRLGRAPLSTDFDGALAALAIGDFARVRRVLLLEPDRSEEFLLLLTRYFAASADIDFVRGQWPRCREFLPGDLPAVLRHELAIMAESVGERADPILLKAPVSSGDVPASSRDFDHESDSWLDRAIIRFVYDGLGFQPEAFRNRLHLGPWLPSAWTILDLENLRVGENTIGLHYRRDGRAHAFTIAPLAGPLPLRVIFAPAVAGRSAGRVLVDELPAALDLRAQSGRIVCPVQLELDREHSVVIEGAGE